MFGNLCIPDAGHAGKNVLLTVVRTYKNETKGGRTYTFTLPVGKAWKLHTTDKYKILTYT
jgi:hypothetical protein